MKDHAIKQIVGRVLAYYSAPYVHVRRTENRIYYVLECASTDWPPYVKLRVLREDGTVDTIGFSRTEIGFSRTEIDCFLTGRIVQLIDSSRWEMV